MAHVNGGSIENRAPLNTLNMQKKSTYVGTPPLFMSIAEYADDPNDRMTPFSNTVLLPPGCPTPFSYIVPGQRLALLD